MIFDPSSMTDEERAALIARMDAEDREPDGRHRNWDRITDFVRYDLATGAITAHGQMSIAAIEHEDSLYGGDGYLMAKGDPTTHWVDVRRQRVRFKSRCPARVDGPYLRELPVPCRLTITDDVGDVTEHDCDTGYLDLSEADPGFYGVTVVCVPHQTETFIIEV